MLAVMVRTPDSSESGMMGMFPATMTTAMVSPMARPSPSTMAAMMPEAAAGATTLNTACS